MKRRFLIIVALIIALTSCTKKPGVLTGNVYWKFNDYVGNKPDAGCKVRLYSITNKEIIHETTTDVLGNFKIEEIIPGNYFLIIQSNNTNDSPSEHLSNLLIYSSDLKDIFGFNDSSFKNEIDEITQLQKISDNILNKYDVNNMERMEDQIKKENEMKDEINDKADKLISKFPEEFKIGLNLLTGYDNSFYFTTIQIDEGKTSNQNVDFGVTYF